VPISHAQFAEELCFFCKNTLTLQRANAFTETAIASDKLKQFSSFSKYLAGIDFDSVKNSLSAVHDLDVHLKHLLLNHDELKAHQNRTERVEANLSKISDIIDSNIQSTTKESIDTLSTNVQHLQDQLLAFTKSAPVLSSDTSATDQLLDRISKQLEELTINPPAPPPSEPSHSPQPLTPRITEATHHELHVHHSRDDYIDPELESELMEYFESCIDKFHAEGDHTRYSITFRSVSHKNRNSTCIIGDSNTCGLKFGTDPKKSFGQWLPGKQVFTPVIEDIDPHVALGYRNIVVHCAINNLKKDEVKNIADIKRLFSLYVNKIENIQAVNPQAHVYICPPLPSKRAELNRKSLYFIKLIRDELIPSNFGVTLVDGFDGFLDQAGLLSQHLSRNLNRYQKPDYLHLNWKGVAKLGILIRNTVLLRMNGGTDRRRSSRNNGHLHDRVTEGYAGAAANGFGHNHDGYQS
ncbi:hypothetical protein ACHWQZ_G005045, partial [Mnemiopsis leidyi]